MCGCNRGVVGGRATGHVVTRNVPVVRAAPRAAVAPPVAVAPAAQPYRVNSRGPVFRQNVMSQARVPQRRGDIYIPPVPVPQYVAETTVWGPLLWNILHTLAAMVPDISKWTTLLTLLTTTIPCEICRTHYTQYYNDHPVTGDIATWLFVFHNDVNHRIGKPLFPIENLPVATGQPFSLNIQALSVSFPPEVLAALEDILR